MLASHSTSLTSHTRLDMATVFREQILGMTRRDIACLQGRLAAARKSERNIKSLLSQQRALLQVVCEQALTTTHVVLSPSGVDVKTQTDERPGQFDNNEDHWVAPEDFMISPVYLTLEKVLVEMANKGVGTVFLSDWLVSLLAIIRRLKPDVLSFSNYYYENETRAPGSPLHMVNPRAGIYFMSALDSMCTYSPAGTDNALFPDSEALLHYAVAYASRLSDRDISYVHFCNDPLCYDAEKLAMAINITIEDIVKFIKKNPVIEQPTLSINSIPDSYGPVVDAVNDLLLKGANARGNCALLQFLPLAAATSQKRGDITQKEKLFLGMIIRTALMWYMTYVLSSKLQGSSIVAYQDLLARCMTRDPIVLQSLCKAHKGPYLSTGMLLPGLFAYIFYVSKETGMPQKVGSFCMNAPMTLHNTTQDSQEFLHKWSTADFEVRGKMAQFIAGDSVIKSDAAPTVAAFGHTPKTVLQGQIDSALVSFLHALIMHKNTYEGPSQAAIGYMKEVSSTREYLQTSQGTMLTEYKVGRGHNMAFEAMNGFLKNPFLYKMKHTRHYDTYGRGTVQTTPNTVVSSAIRT